MAENSPAMKIAMRNCRIMVRNSVDIAATMIRSIILLIFSCLTMFSYLFSASPGGLNRKSVSERNVQGLRDVFLVHNKADFL